MTAYEKLVAENAVLKDRLQREATKRAMTLLMTRKLIGARLKIDQFLEQVCKHALVEPGSERSQHLLRNALAVLARNPLNGEIPESSSQNSPTSSTDSSSAAPSEESTSAPPRSPPPSSPS